MYDDYHRERREERRRKWAKAFLVMLLFAITYFFWRASR